jgi:hypothetical protein
MKNKLIIIILSLAFLNGCQSSSKVEVNTNNKEHTTGSNIKISQSEINTEDSKAKDFPIHLYLDKDGVIVAEDEKYIYYCLNNSINKIDKTNGEINIISVQPDIFPSSLFYYSDYLYFVTYNKGKGESNCKVLKMNVNSGEYFEAFDMQHLPDLKDAFIRSLLVIEDTIYMDCSSTVCSYNMNTKEVKLLVDEDITIFDVVGDNLYYTDHAQRTFTIYKKNLKTMEKQFVLGDGKNEPKDAVQYRDFIFTPNEMYYIALGPIGLETTFLSGVFAYNNGKPVAISSPDSQGYALLEYKGEFYYIDSTPNKEGKHVNSLKNKNGFKIAELPDYYYGVWRPKIINDYLYYKTKENEVKSLRLNLQN